MHTPDFKLHPLRTLGICLACGALIAGCAGNGVKPMDQDTGPVSSAQVNSQPLANNGENSAGQTPTASAAPLVSDNPVTTAQTNSSSSQPEVSNTSAATTDSIVKKPMQTTASTMEPTQTTFYFGINKTSLDEKDKAILLEHARFLKANPTLVLEINGHTDSTGTHAYNEYLSKRRAEAVAKVLINDGVTRSQLVINALADNKPLPDQTDLAKNRRVELQYDDMSMVSSK